LPESGFSDISRDFVKGCLNKVPKLRPTYAMLLNHPWLKPLTKPETITEEAEEGDEVDEVADAVGKINLDSGTQDEEVAAWVRGVLERKNEGQGADGASPPALHKVNLDTVSPMASPAAGA
jgi:mitogen-activated protein kinase kinase